jgi:hypothetical protein
VDKKQEWVRRISRDDVARPVRNLQQLFCKVRYEIKDLA